MAEDLDYRNGRIRWRRRKGETLARIAKDYGLTRERIRQICIGIPKPSLGYVNRNRAIYTEKRTKTIYGIYAEGEDMPRYIGATKKTKLRISTHRNAIRFTEAIYRIELPDLGLQIRTIEEVPEGQDWKVRERLWINHFVALGAELANADPEETHRKLVEASARRADRGGSQNKVI